VPDAARPAIEHIVASDERVRFLDRQKGRGHGFRHRDKAVRRAKGDAILYLADDDIWLPEHVALMCAAVEEAEFVAALALTVIDGEVRLKMPHDLAERRWRRLMLDGRTMFNLSVIGHTRPLYDRLETGWRRNDPDYKALWGEFARHAKRMATVRRPTAIVLPSARRTDMSDSSRLDEIRQFSELTREPTGRLDLLERLLEHEVHRWSRLTLKVEEGRAQSRRVRQAASEATPALSHDDRPKKAVSEPGQGKKRASGAKAPGAAATPAQPSKKATRRPHTKGEPRP
jgi:Glycosyl transferase family 2